MQKLIGSSVPPQLFTCTHNGCCERHHGEVEDPVSVPRGLGYPGTGQVSLHPQATPADSGLGNPHQPNPLLIPRFFRRLDKDGSRSLDAGELRRGLAQLGLEVDEAEAEALCRCWDCDGSGTLDLEEFLRALRVRLASVPEGLVRGADPSTPQSLVPLL